MHSANGGTSHPEVSKAFTLAHSHPVPCVNTSESISGLLVTQSVCFLLLLNLLISVTLRFRQTWSFARKYGHLRDMNPKSQMLHTRAGTYQAATASLYSILRSSNTTRTCLQLPFQHSTHLYLPKVTDTEKDRLARMQRKMFNHTTLGTAHHWILGKCLPPLRR